MNICSHKCFNIDAKIVKHALYMVPRTPLGSGLGTYLGALVKRP